MIRVLIPALVVLGAVVAGFFFWQRRARPAAGPKPGRALAAPPEAGNGALLPASRTTGGSAGRLAGDLARWVAAGLITADQAGSITAFERAAAPAAGIVGGEQRVSLLAEALGYVGVVLALAGAGVGLAQGWEDLPGWARVVIPAAASALLVLGGFLLRRQQEPAFRRLMSVLWALAVGGSAWALAVLGVEVMEWEAETIALLASGGAALLAGALYLARRHGLQQVTLLASLLALVVSGLVALPGERHPGWWFAVAVWALGAAWAETGRRNLTPPGWLAVACGLAAMVVGPALGLGDYSWLLAPALLTTAGLVALSVPTRQTPLLALGMVGAFGYITWAVVHYFRDSLGVPLALVIIGIVFLVLAVLAGVLAARNRAEEPKPGG